MAKKISEYGTVSSVSGSDIFLVETSTTGTKTITATNLAKGLTGLSGGSSAGPAAPANKWTFRGEQLNLDASDIPDILTKIGDGEFTDLYLGDYFYLDKVAFRIVDFDYWYGISSGKHHLVLMPDSPILVGHPYIDGSDDFPYGAANSFRKEFQAEDWYAKITTFFSGHILTYKEYFATSTNSGGTVLKAQQFDATIEAPTEQMIFGNRVLSVTPSTASAAYTNSPRQLTLLRKEPEFILAKEPPLDSTAGNNLEKSSYILRDSISASNYSSVSEGGVPREANSNSGGEGVRPVFAVIA